MVRAHASTIDYRPRDETCNVPVFACCTIVIRSCVLSEALILAFSRSLDLFVVLLCFYVCFVLLCAHPNRKILNPPLLPPSGQGFLLVYNIVARPTFDEVRVLYDKILRTKDTYKVPIVLVGEPHSSRQ